MLMRLVVAVIAVVGLTAWAPAPMPRAPRKPKPSELMKAIKGTWEIENRTMVGARVPARGAPVRTNMRARIEEGRWTFLRILGTDERPTITYLMSIDATKSPAWIDLKREGTDTPFLRGIIAVEGNTLRFSYSSALGARKDGVAPTRPSTFEAASGQFTMTMKRVGQ